MTRKDYVLLAETLAKANPAKLPASLLGFSPLMAQAFKGQWETDCEAIADALQADNPRFDRARFLGRCGVTR